MSIWVSDETWSQLDPSAGRLRGRSRIAVAVALVAAVALVVAGVAVGRSGLFSPRIHADLQEVVAPSGSHTVTETFILSTGGTFDERVVGIASGEPGLRVAAISPLPATIPQSGSLTFTVRVTVTDCGAIGDQGLPVILHVHRWWGTASHSIGQGGPGDQPDVNPDVFDQICG